MAKLVEQLAHLEKEGIRAGLETCGAAAGVILEVAVMDDEGQVRLVDVGDEVREFGIVSERVRKIADQREREIRRFRCCRQLPAACVHRVRAARLRQGNARQGRPAQERAP